MDDVNDVSPLAFAVISASVYGRDGFEMLCLFFLGWLLCDSVSFSIGAVGTAGVLMPFLRSAARCCLKSINTRLFATGSDPVPPFSPMVRAHLHRPCLALGARTWVWLTGYIRTYSGGSKKKRKEVLHTLLKALPGSHGKYQRTHIHNFINNNLRACDSYMSLSPRAEALATAYPEPDGDKGSCCTPNINFH